MSLIVAKFGGSSMADAQAIMRSAQVAKQQKGLGILVVSATAGTTDRMIQLAHLAEQGSWSKAKEIFQAIEFHHWQIAQELKVEDQVQSQVKKLLREAKALAKGMFYLRDCSPKALDSLLSIGELISPDFDSSRCINCPQIEMRGSTGQNGLKIKKT